MCGVGGRDNISLSLTSCVSKRTSSIVADLLEGLKRAQRFRLEDQRGTEINFELPDFLKDNDINSRNKFRKTKAGSSASDEAAEQSNSAETVPPIKVTPPQPAPRFLNKQPLNVSATNDNESSPANHESRLNSSGSSTTSSSINGGSNHYENGEYITTNGHKAFGAPPPLPPKPKIKPSNWSAINGNAVAANVSPTKDSAPINGELSPRRNDIPTPRSIYLDQPNSSFV